MRRNECMSEPKILKKGKNTYRNGGSALCGGIVSKSMFDSDPWAYMMAYYMEDDKFETYKKLKSSANKKDEKSAKEWFRKYAKSAI